MGTMSSELSKPRTLAAEAYVRVGSAAAAWLVLLAAVPCLLLLPLEGQASPAFVLTVLIVGYSGARLAYLSLAGRPRYLSLSFWVFVYVFMGVVPMLSTWRRQFPFPSVYSPSLAEDSALVVLLGLVAMDAGTLLGAWLCTQRRRRPPGEFWLDESRLHLLSFLVILFSTAVVMATGGFLHLLMPRGVGVAGPDLDQMQQLISDALIRKPPAAVIMLALWAWVHRKRLLGTRRHTVVHLALVAILLLFNAAANNPLNAPRLWSGALLICGMLILYRWRGSRSFALWAVGMCVGLIIFFSPLDPRWLIGNAVRGGQFAFDLPQVVASTPEKLSVSGDFDAFAMLANTIQYTREHGITYGHQLLGPAFFWVPRSLWADKPIGTGTMVAKQAEWWHTNVSCPFWAEGYANFGVLGVLLFFLIYGAVIGYLEYADRYPSSLRSQVLAGVAIPFLAGNNFVFLRGDLMTGVQHALIFLICLWVATRYVVRPQAPPAGNGPDTDIAGDVGQGPA